MRPRSLTMVSPRLIFTQTFYEVLGNPVFPLILLGLFVVFQLITGATVLSAVAFIAGLAFVQNIAYSLQSRSATRNSNLYHMIAAVSASLTFFVTQQYLVRNDLPLTLLSVYVFGTVLGSMHGKKLSQHIEKVIDAATGPSDKNKSQFLQFWPSVAVLAVALVLEVVFLSDNPFLLFTISGLSFLGGLGFAIVRVTRNADNHWIHFGAVLFEAVIAFALLQIMVKQNMDWILFIPNATGGMLSSLLGSELAKKILTINFSYLFSWTTLLLRGRRQPFNYDLLFVVVGTDRHVKEGRAINVPVLPLLAGAGILVFQFPLFGLMEISRVAMLMAAVLAMSISFSMVSRARQRSSDAYVVWCSFLSNGIWYMTRHLLVQDSMPNYLFIPNTSATAVGALAGQDISMRIEKKIGAVMDESKPLRKPADKVSPA